MIILALRTDRPQAEMYLYEDHQQLARLTWQAHRELTKTIHKKIQQILNPSTSLGAGKSRLSLDDLGGIVVFEGPGSFTGLRTGSTVANTLAYAEDIPIVATGGQNWILAGIRKLKADKNDRIALPRYGHPANISQPKK